MIPSNKRYAILTILLVVLLPGSIPGVPLKTWQEQPLNMPGGWPDLYLDPNGDLHVICADGFGWLYYKKLLLTQWDGEGAIPFDGSIPVTPPNAKCDVIFGLPHIVADSKGNPHIVWAAYGRPRVGPVYYQTLVDGQWLPEAEIVSRGETDWIGFPEIGIDANDQLYVVAEQVYDKDYDGFGFNQIIFKYKDKESGDWLPPDDNPGGLQITRFYWNPQIPDIAIDPMGNLHVCWEQPSNEYTEIGYIYFNGFSWDPISLIADFDKWCTRSRILCDAHGDPYVAATVMERQGEDYWFLSGIAYLERHDNQWDGVMFGRNHGNTNEFRTGFAINDNGLLITWPDYGDVQYWYKRFDEPIHENIDSFSPSSKQAFTLNSVAAAGDGEVFYVVWEDSRGGLFYNMLSEISTSAPRIIAGGYMQTRIKYESGGALELACIVDDDVGPYNIQSVEILYDGIPTGLMLTDNTQYGLGKDYRDGIWRFEIPFIPPWTPWGDYLLELQATNRDGLKSEIWPWCHIVAEQSAQRQALNLWDLPGIKTLMEFNWEAEFLRSVNGAADLNSTYDRYGPFVSLAGYLTATIPASGGAFSMIAAASDGNGAENLSGVELCYAGNTTGIFMEELPVGLDSMSKIYRLDLELGQAPAGDYLLELIAYDEDGNRSLLWPYLNIASEDTLGY